MRNILGTLRGGIGPWPTLEANTFNGAGLV